MDPAISEFYGEKSSGNDPKLYAPEVEGYSLDVTANTTDSKILYCIFTGDPKPEVSWNHNIAHAQQVDNIIKRFSQVMSRLMIRNLTYHDSGKVSCSGKNVVGQSKADGFLNVYRKSRLYKYHSIVSKGKVILVSDPSEKGGCKIITLKLGFLHSYLLKYKVKLE